MHHVQGVLHVVHPAFFALEIKERTTVHLVCAKICGLGEVQVTLAEPIFPQNFVDFGHLLIFKVTT
jgi:hypothetical protein